MCVCVSILLKMLNIVSSDLMGIKGIRFGDFMPLKCNEKNDIMKRDFQIHKLIVRPTETSKESNE